jgi:hypothetical protein
MILSAKDLLQKLHYGARFSLFFPTLMFYIKRSNKKTMPWSWKYFCAIFLVGSILLTFGYVVAWYPQSVISGLEDRLNNSNLSQNDKWDVQGSLAWWKLAKVDTFAPLSNIIILLGVLLILLSITYSIFAIWNNSRHKHLKDKWTVEDIRKNTEKITENSPSPKITDNESEIPEAADNQLTKNIQGSKSK